MSPPSCIFRALRLYNFSNSAEPTGTALPGQYKEDRTSIGQDLVRENVRAALLETHRCTGFVRLAARAYNGIVQAHSLRIDAAKSASEERPHAATDYRAGAVIRGRWRLLRLFSVGYGRWHGNSRHSPGNRSGPLSSGSDTNLGLNIGAAAYRCRRPPNWRSQARGPKLACTNSRYEISGCLYGLVKGANQLGLHGLFRQKSSCPAELRYFTVCIGGKRGDQNYANIGPFLVYRQSRFNPVHLRHGNVHQYDVRLQLLRESKASTPSQASPTTFKLGSVPKRALAARRTSWWSSTTRTSIGFMPLGRANPRLSSHVQPSAVLLKA